MLSSLTYVAVKHFILIKLYLMYNFYVWLRLSFPVHLTNILKIFAFSKNKNVYITIRHSLNSKTDIISNWLYLSSNGSVFSRTKNTKGSGMFRTINLESLSELVWQFHVTVFICSICLYEAGVDVCYSQWDYKVLIFLLEPKPKRKQTKLKQI